MAKRTFRPLWRKLTQKIPSAPSISVHMGRVPNIEQTGARGIRGWGGLVTMGSLSTLLSSVYSSHSLEKGVSWTLADRAGTMISSCRSWFSVWEGQKWLSSNLKVHRNLQHQAPTTVDLLEHSAELTKQPKFQLFMGHSWCPESRPRPDPPLSDIDSIVKGPARLACKSSSLCNFQHKKSQTLLKS